MYHDEQELTITENFATKSINEVSVLLHTSTTQSKNDSRLNEMDKHIEVLKSRIQTLESRHSTRCPNQDPNDQEMDGIDHFAQEQEYVCENSDESCNRVCTKLYDCCFDENCKNEDKFIFDGCPNCKCSKCILETSPLSEEKEHKGKDLTQFLGIRK